MNQEPLSNRAPFLASPDKAKPAEAKSALPAPKSSLARQFFSRNPLHWVGAALAFGGVAAVLGGAIAAGGVINLSAVPPHPDGWAHMLHYGMTRSVAHHASEPPGHEPLDSPTLIMAGAASYAVVCQNCHGAPGYGQSPVALSMRPEPPELTQATTRYSDKELFFIVQNGVRYSGMPAWSVPNRPEEIWSLVAFLKTAPKLTREAYNQLAHGDPKELARARALAPNAGTGISAFIPSTTEKPYLPGDPQEAFASPNATMLPRGGYSNIAAGDAPLTACVSCHGSDGTGRAGGLFPNLTLQTPQYLYDALHAYASGQRQSGVMWAIAGNLTDEQMRSLANQLGAGPPLRSHDPAPNKLAAGEKDRGADLIAAGAGMDAGAADIVPPEVKPGAVERCSSCHLPQTYLGRVVPKLDGQYAPYLSMQMYAFRAGGRGDTSTYNPMVADSHHLSDADIEALAKLYASRPPLPKEK